MTPPRLASTLRPMTKRISTVVLAAVTAAVVSGCCCLPLDICLGLTSINADDAGDQPRAEVPPSRG